MFRSLWRCERGCIGPRLGVGHPTDERGSGVRHALGRATDPLADALRRRRVRPQRRARHRAGHPAGHLGRTASHRRGACGHPLRPRRGLTQLRRRAAQRMGPGAGAQPQQDHSRTRLQLMARPSTRQPVPTPRGPCRGADPQAGALLPRRTERDHEQYVEQREPDTPGRPVQRDLVRHADHCPRPRQTQAGRAAALPGGRPSGSGTVSGKS